MDEKKEKNFLSIGDYSVRQSGELLHGAPMKNRETGEIIGVENTPIANHAPILQEQRTIDNGIEITEELVFNVRRAGRSWGNVPVTIKDILSNQPNMKFGGACRIYPGVRGGKAWYSDFMQIQCENAPARVVYTHTGYAEIDGERVFLNGGYSVTKEGLTDRYTVNMAGKLKGYSFTNERHPERYRTLLEDLPKVAPKPLIYAGLAYTFLSPLNEILRDNGIEPRFILYIIGRTNVGKTMLADVFISFFGTFPEGESAPISFKDTPNAAEMAMALLDSTLTLLDDRIPPTTKGVKDQMERMEQNVARAIGDRAGRARLNADSTLKSVYRPKCNLIITAEEAYSNVGESAIARSISCELKPGDMNWDALTKVQQNTIHLNECMSEYIQFVLANWDSLSEELKPLFIEWRKRAQTGEYGRLATNVAHLQIGMYVMCKWLVSVGAISKKQSEDLLAESWKIFLDLAAAQCRRIVEEKPTELFLNAVKELINREEIKLYATDKVHEDFNRVVGYKDKCFCYFSGSEIYERVRQFYLDQGENFPVSMNTLFRELAAEGFIDTQKDRSGKMKNTKNIRIGGEQKKMLCVRVNALKDKEGENSD